MIQEKIESSILNCLGYIGRLEKKNGDELAYKFLSISEAIGLELGEASMHQQDRLKEAYQELLSQESIAYSNDEWER